MTNNDVTLFFPKNITPDIKYAILESFMDFCPRYMSIKDFVTLKYINKTSMKRVICRTYCNIDKIKRYCAYGDVEHARALFNLNPFLNVNEFDEDFLNNMSKCESITFETLLFLLNINRKL